MTRRLNRSLATLHCATTTAGPPDSATSCATVTDTNEMHQERDHDTGAGIERLG